VKPILLEPPSLRPFVLKSFSYTSKPPLNSPKRTSTQSPHLPGVSFNLNTTTNHPLYQLTSQAIIHMQPHIVMMSTSTMPFDYSQAMPFDFYFFPFVKSQVVEIT